MKKSTISQAKADLYATINPLLKAMYREVQELSKKKPDGTLSAAKVKILNRLLEDVRVVLNDEMALKYLDLIEDDSLPQYSDLVLILSQYSAAMQSFHGAYYGYNELLGESRWAVGKPLVRS
jgi:hypothetical protein